MAGRRRAGLVVSVWMAFIVFVAVFGVVLNVPLVKASGTIYIRADGSIDPTDAPISSVDNVTYIFTDNINDSIVVERDNIVVDGAGYTLQGTGGRGIDLMGRSNVIIKTMNIKGFSIGINVQGYTIVGGGANNVIQTNNITNNRNGIYLSRGVNNKIYGNNITNNSYGVFFDSSNKNNTVHRNNITNNELGICLDGYISATHKECPENNTIYENNIADNTEAGVKLLGLDNIFYHNNFLNNTIVIGSEFSSGGTNDPELSKNILDNGCPSGGNYWSDYTGVDANGDGIGDTPYIINANNRDRYPLMNPWTPTWAPPEQPPPTPPEVKVGVKIGDWIKITYAISGWPAGTPYPEWLKVEFLSVEGTSATIRVTMRMSDGAEQNATVPVDVAAGGQALGLSGFVIPANSTVGDSINFGGFGLTSTTTIEGETTRTYAGATRTVVYASISQYGTQLTYYWDKQTGVMVEASVVSGGMTGTGKATETNMWQAQPLGLPIDPTVLYILIIAVIAIATGIAFFAIRKKKKPSVVEPPQS